MNPWKGLVNIRLLPKQGNMGENFIVTSLSDMSLTAGATLQNRKYIIQKLLHQSDFGVTYRAHHAYLEQDVVLQTLNSALRQRNDFQQIRQQFLNKVRSIAQEVNSVRVIDCFEEGEMPFVVFELAPGQAPPQLVDWFPLMPHTVNPLGTVAQAESPQNSSPSAVSSASSAATVETVPPAPAPVATQPLVIASSNGKTAIATQAVSWTPPRSRSTGWMPIALVSLSMLAGLLGAAFGLLLRLSATSPQQAGVERIPRLTPHLFSREQSFPAETDWPISETPQFFTTDPTPVEDPVYRVKTQTENYTSPDFQFPHEVIPSPVSPIQDLPAVSTPTPINPTVTTPSVAVEQPAPQPIAPPISEPPAAQSIPAEPAPPVSLPEVPAPVIPDLPVPNAAPAPPPLPTVNSPKTIN